ncbi:MAG: holo-[acyl-carrier-protein] synthase [Chlorobiaceae bacterium]|jgi:holo-[acyl-carrier protein] synthase|nr:holo-[acyl-carrier-protein] synthase [Chlorobiaceae bacterium]NTV16066.1 holo-[acyl-carrier-protein] synthase [Chlorobiaceae bacterium]
MDVGVDIVDLDRIASLYSRYGMKFLQRFLSEAEIALCLHKPQVVASIAGRFAAKEAVVKALGTGFSDGVHWKSFEILNDERGRPFVQPADASCFSPGCSIKISIAHDHHAAVAMALIDGL